MNKTRFAVIVTLSAVGEIFLLVLALVWTVSPEIQETCIVTVCNDNILHVYTMNREKVWKGAFDYNCTQECGSTTECFLNVRDGELSLKSIWRRNVPMVVGSWLAFVVNTVIVVGAIHGYSKEMDKELEKDEYDLSQPIQ